MTAFLSSSTKSRVRTRSGSRMPQDFVNTWLPAVTASLSQKHPRVHLQATVGRSPDVIRCLDEGESISPWSMGRQMDVGVYGRDRCPWFGLERRTLRSTAPIRCPFPAVFDPPCAFRGAAIDALEGVGLPWTVAFASPTLASLWGAVGAGLGVTVRTPLGLPPGLKIMREGLPTLPSVSLSPPGCIPRGRRNFAGRVFRGGRYRRRGRSKPPGSDLNA